jgi:hypothetical protein
MNITALEKSADFTTLDTEKLFSKLKSYELFRNGRPNHDASLTNNALITSTHVGGHDANPTNTTVSSVLEFVLSSLSTASNEQYESIPDDKIVLLMRKFHACISSVRRGGDHLGADLSVATPLTSSLTAPRERNLTPPTSMTTLSGTIASRTMTRSTTSGIRKRKRSSKR